MYICMHVPTGMWINTVKVVIYAGVLVRVSIVKQIAQVFNKRKRDLPL